MSKIKLQAKFTNCAIYFEFSLVEEISEKSDNGVQYERPCTMRLSKSVFDVSKRSTALMAAKSEKRIELLLRLRALTSRTHNAE